MKKVINFKLLEVKIMNRIKTNFLMKMMIFVIFFLSLTNLSFVSVYAQSSYLSIVTAGATGTYYPVGAALGKVLTDNIPNLYATAEVSGGSIENIRLVSNGEADIGLATQLAIKLAISGEPPFEEPITNLRALFPLAGTDYVATGAWQLIVPKDSPINSVYDLKGKKVAVGPAGSGGETYTKMVLDAHGMSYDDLTPFFYSYSEAGAAMQDGVIDAEVINSSGVPTAAVLELAASRKIRLVSIDPAIIQKLKNEWGFFGRVISPDEYPEYPWLEDSVTTVAASSDVIFVNKDADEEMVYKIVKAAMENKEDIWASNPASKNYDEQGVVIGLKTPPLHKGAYKYFKEFGIDVPEIVIPPELK